MIQSIALDSANQTTSARGPRKRISAAPAPGRPQDEAELKLQLLQILARYTRDPLGFVEKAFPWKEDELAGFNGPEEWQRAVLIGIRDGLLTPNQAIQIAIASGHGVGKSALVAWIILWSLATFEDTKGVVTANTETQLKTKTWAELSKWYRLFLGRSLFKMTATAIYSADPAHERTWRVDMVPWSERNTEAFAGLHNKGKRVLVIFDEASAIPDAIWETTEGALTDADTQILWLVCGNPTRNSGRFRECFGRYRYRWRGIQVDSRTVSITNKTQFDRWVRDYGEDSDFARVRIRGTFPRVGSVQFISTELVEQAQEASRFNELNVHPFEPFLIGVDVARFGDDASVIYCRKGRDARSIAPAVFRGVSTMTLATRAAEAYHQYHADALFVDGGGVGGGVVDRLRQLKVPVFDIQFGAKSDRSDAEEVWRYANKRAEMWGHLRRWLEVGSIPGDGEIGQQLRDDLIGPEYGLNSRDEIQLERKEDMKKRGLSSPDLADALALTFAYPVMPNPRSGSEFARLLKPKAQLAETEYDPLDRRLILGGIDA